MELNLIKSEINGVLINKIKTHSDHRGFFRELLRLPILNSNFSYENTQISHSEVFPGVLKAWHAHVYQYQWTYVAKGTLLVALVDKREDSTSFNKVTSFISSSNSDPYIYGFPPGVYHGYKNLSDTAEIIYVTNGHYDKNDELRINSNSDEIPFSWELKYN